MLDAENPSGELSTPPTTPSDPAPDSSAAPPADTGAEAGAADQPAKKAAKKAPAKKSAAKKPAAKKTAAKRTTKKAAAGEPEAPAAVPEAPAADQPPVPAEAGAAAEAPAEETPAKKAAKKAPAKKAAAKKTAAKRTTKKAAAAEAESPVEAPSEAPEQEQAADEGGAAAKIVPVPLFQPPAATKGSSRRTRATAETPDAGSDAEPTEASETAEAPDEKPATRTRKAAAKPERAADETDETDSADETDGQDDEGGQGGNRRRRRRGGRRRRRSGDNGDGQQDDTEDSDDQTSSGSDDTSEADGAEGSTSSRRRRRRRRSGDEGNGGADDPQNTVTRVRKARNPEDEITALSGSTRLEAKKQRRREGREAGRRRAPIVSEAEFLARREAVDRVMVIRQKQDLTQIAVMEDKVLVEHYVARESQTSLIGNVYLGRVQNVLPSMEAAFIDIGKGRNAVLYAGEVNWDALGAGNGPRKIEQVLKSGQSVLVQVTKDPVGHKGARLTSQVSLPGRFLVYVPDGTTSGISRKLPDTERNRLKTLLKEIVPDSAGVIVRTAAEGASEEELTRDVERLTARWEDISQKVEKGNAPQLLYGEPDLTLKVVRDLFTEDFGKLVVSGDDAWDMVESYVGHVAPDLGDRLERYDGDEDVFAAYRIDEQIAKALDRKVWLPSGGSLIIDRTEAMTVVDVNTGKFTGSGGNLEETVTKNNLEAAEEIVRQLRLRDIGGIIVVDFIDMVLESNRDLVLRRLVECLGRDRTRHQVAEVTSLGLVQMTRKRIGTGLLEAFSESCEHCQGRGLVIHHEPVEPKRKQDEEPRRSRRGRGRGGDDESGSGNGSGRGSAAPSPKEVAAMAKPPKADADLPDSERPTAAADGAGGADESVPEPSAGEPAGADLAAAEETGSRSARGRRRGSRTRQGGDRETEVDTPTAEQPDAAAEQPDAAAERPDQAAEQPEAARPAPEPPAEQPTTRTTTRTRRGSSRREAGPPPGAAAPAAVVVVPASVLADEPDASAGTSPGTSRGAAATTGADGADKDATAAPRVVTSTRRRVARRPAGPPVGGPDDVPARNGAPAPAADQAPDERGADEHADADDDGVGVASAAAHVPVKKKGSRKR